MNNIVDNNTASCSYLQLQQANIKEKNNFLASLNIVKQRSVEKEKSKSVQFAKKLELC